MLSGVGKTTQIKRWFYKRRIKMFKYNQKVVPIKKSVYNKLENSTIWRRAKNEKQDFLYFVGRSKHDKNTFMCSYLPDCESGDLFLLSDLVPYTEEPEEQKKDTNLKVDEPFVLTFSIKELNDMVKNGILKETDQFIIQRA